jgi:hypothetical protein
VAFLCTRSSMGSLPEFSSRSLGVKLSSVSIDRFPPALAGPPWLRRTGQCRCQRQANRGRSGRWRSWNVTCSTWITRCSSSWCFSKEDKVAQSPLMKWELLLLSHATMQHNASASFILIQVMETNKLFNVQQLAVIFFLLLLL